MMINYDVNGCEVEIESSTGGGTYYTDCSNISKLGEHLENYSNSTIYLYRFKAISNSNFNPYIVISPFSLPRYRGTQNANYIELANVTKVTYNDVANYYYYSYWLQVALVFAVFVNMLFRIFKRG